MVMFLRLEPSILERDIGWRKTDCTCSPSSNLLETPFKSVSTPEPPAPCPIANKWRVLPRGFYFAFKVITSSRSQPLRVIACDFLTFCIQCRQITCPFERPEIVEVGRRHHADRHTWCNVVFTLGWHRCINQLGICGNNVFRKSFFLIDVQSYL